MSQTTIPRTPTPETINDDDFSPLQSPSHAKDILLSRQIQAAMTPPPSSQIPSGPSRFGQPTSFTKRESSLASPPPTFRGDPPISAGMLFGEVPAVEAVASMTENELRRLTVELIPALGEARINAAHSKLQHSLLSIETEEVIKRAEVEQEAMKREVQVFQEGSPAPHTVVSPLASPAASVQRELKQALYHCGGLQQENSLLRKRLRSSKKLITQLDSENGELKEQVTFLRQRIKDNRDHLNEMQESGAMSLQSTPRHDYSMSNYRHTPRTPASGRINPDAIPQTPGSRNFAALLHAAEMDSASNSVPASPSQQKQRRLQHMRGAHSLSSLPMTPDRRPVTAGGPLKTPVSRAGEANVSFSAPGTQLVFDESRRQDDRESTISASDGEGHSDGEDEPSGSQASQMASSMLRRTLEAQRQQPSQLAKGSREGKLTQSRLYGQVQKARGGNGGNNLKRKAPHDGYDGATDAVEHPAERIGLGIGSWPSPAR